MSRALHGGPRLDSHSVSVAIFLTFVYLPAFDYDLSIHGSKPFPVVNPRSQARVSPNAYFRRQ